MDIDLAAAALGFRHIAHDTIGSTNAEALSCARAGEPGPLWITARTQSAGRGRRGRTWVSEPGNLYATLLVVDPAPADKAPQLSFVAALAAHDALSESDGALGPRLKLKWPNDVLCDGAKLAGILIEGEGAGPSIAVAIGIGINCAHHPDGTDYPATDLKAAGSVASAQQVFRALSRTIIPRMAQWNAGEGFAAIRADWLKRAAGLGGEMRVRLGAKDLTGRFQALDASGRLLLRLPDGGLEPISSGDVFPLFATATTEH